MIPDYLTTCPKCGEPIILTGFVASCRIPVTEDGWSYDEGPCDSSDETFACQAGCGPIPADWVMGAMTPTAALTAMAAGPTKEG